VPECTGEWRNELTSVTFRRGTSGRLYWDFYLTNVARRQLGLLVTVSMPVAAVNGRPINPPYQPHWRWSGYDFHGSFDTYAYVGGGGGGPLSTGDQLTFLWYIQAFFNEGYVVRYIHCQVPVPGTG
jgi:hypothetical protein